MKNLNPQPNDAYIFAMTDDTGMFQHSKFGVPDPSFGYTTDDNARALIMAQMLYAQTKEHKYIELAYVYLQFLLYAQHDGQFQNFMNYSRVFIDTELSQDCFGRVVWALCYTLHCELLPKQMLATVKQLLKEALPHVHWLTALRAQAYCLYGLSLFRVPALQKEREHLAKQLCYAFLQTTTPDWPWFEPSLRYCNAILPLSLFAYVAASKDKQALHIGKSSLDFLLEQTFTKGVFSPIGCNGWYEKGKEKAVYDQQPVEACETLLACLAAYKATKNVPYLRNARQCLQWYVGENIAGLSLINEVDGGCKDGITAFGINQNQGAESLLSWHIAWLSWHSFQANL